METFAGYYRRALNCMRVHHRRRLFLDVETVRARDPLFLEKAIFATSFNYADEFALSAWPSAVRRQA
jgi:hypothetical protein